jgi:hypothetical protein
MKQQVAVAMAPIEGLGFEMVNTSFRTSANVLSCVQKGGI